MPQAIEIFKAKKWFGRIQIPRGYTVVSERPVKVSDLSLRGNAWCLPPVGYTWHANQFMVIRKVENKPWPSRLKLWWRNAWLERNLEAKFHSPWLVNRQVLEQKLLDLKPGEEE